MWPSAPEHSGLRQEFYCAGFNAVCAIVLRTQSQERFYSGLLFKENPAVRPPCPRARTASEFRLTRLSFRPLPLQKGELLWERIVDTTAVNNFETELAQRFVRKRVAGGTGSSSAALAQLRRASQIRYLSSQYLGTSAVARFSVLRGVLIPCTCPARRLPALSPPSSRPPRHQRTAACPKA